MATKFQRKLPIGLRYKNPLNIKRDPHNGWLGKVKDNKGTFEMFTSFFYGYRAAMKLMQKYIIIYRCETIKDIICRWSPIAENGYEITKGYYKFVAKVLDKEVDDDVDWKNKDLICKMVYAMTVFENGCEECFVEEPTPEGIKSLRYPERLYPIIEDAYDAVEKGV